MEDEEGGGGERWAALAAASGRLRERLHPAGVRGGEVVQQVLMNKVMYTVIDLSAIINLNYEGSED